MQQTPVQVLGWKLCWGRDRLPTIVLLGFPCGSAGEESAHNGRRSGFNPWVGKVLYCSLNVNSNFTVLMIYSYSLLCFLSFILEMLLNCQFLTTNSHLIKNLQKGDLKLQVMSESHQLIALTEYSSRDLFIASLVINVYHISAYQLILHSIGIITGVDISYNCKGNRHLVISIIDKRTMYVDNKRICFLDYRYCQQVFFSSHVCKILCVHYIFQITFTGIIKSDKTNNSHIHVHIHIYA